MGQPLKDVIKELEFIAPLHLAEAWDRVGLIIEPKNVFVRNILLTIDLTEDVVDEAITNECRLIITYHSSMYNPNRNTFISKYQDAANKKCKQNNIAVFSPHTTWDKMNNGMNDWLAGVFDIEFCEPLKTTTNNFPNVGLGRFTKLIDAISLKMAIELVKKHIGQSYLRVGIGRQKNLDSPITTVAICVGAGTSVLNSVVADLYLTGEMLHHDVKAATQQGINVILCNHTDSERGFLKYFRDKYEIEGINMIVSEVDKDCLPVM